MVGVSAWMALSRRSEIKLSEHLDVAKRCRGQRLLGCRSAGSEEQGILFRIKGIDLGLGENGVVGAHGVKALV